MLLDSHRIYYITILLPLWSRFMHLVRFALYIWMTITLTARVQTCVLLHVYTCAGHIIAIAKVISSGSIVQMERDTNWLFLTSRVTSGITSLCVLVLTSTSLTHRHLFHRMYVTHDHKHQQTYLIFLVHLQDYARVYTWMLLLIQCVHFFPTLRSF